ncbi:MAG: DNA alkylation repair protein [Clostridiales bacterium]|jgi:3-methyladenine DNA glycosylase AlkD|nr:DNA alkylation repair protein [Clostridiales bacterium]MCI2161466.1 DNA alkylation repair protein [Oscillospiraceae bacterium]MCI1960797.1 DNA alkylation repair protein [Clostridiales bacterium]MCI2021238.1 DNA alkylation repair protein [Clostridiales bacterium]MCI2025621.1 DNA alkylation repair protein [Clostridiales bacterium]
MKDSKTEVQSELFKMQDLKYRDFQAKLTPTIKKETMIGVRTPQLRKFAAAFSKQPEAEVFLKTLPHKYYEENNLHGFLIERMKDYDACIRALDAFLPYVDNWATCDLMTPKIFQKHLTELLCQIKKWIQSDQTYTIRFGIEMLMSFYLDDKFQPEYLELPAKIKSQEYYVNMMIAWYFATALAKQYKATLPYLEQYRLEPWTHNKAIQKAVESYRITDEQKAYLRTLKVKLPKKSGGI